MKRYSFILIALLMSLMSQASQLVLIPTGSMDLTKQAFSQKGLTINYYNDRFAVGTASSAPEMEYIVLDENAWPDGSLYYILNFNTVERDAYVATVGKIASILHQESDFMVISVTSGKAPQLYPAIHGGMIRINGDAAQLPGGAFHYKAGTIGERTDIWALIGQVDTARLRQSVQHLQDFGTRNCYKSGGLAAQDWIFSKFDSLGLYVELNDFSMPQGPASDNVIAIINGTKYPDEYVVLGAHYDSYAGGSYEPGADDNATGAAGILEIARILSQYTFDRSIIFACWSGEEYGLYGSEAWASNAAQNGMNILGYFNIDMAGYLEPGSYIHTDVIAPSSASELKQFYKDVCAIYLPDFPVENGALSGGDSDHTSFNNNGYQGIFPFEDSQNYSPYIHSTSDIVGLSANNFEQHGTFVQAILASVVSMADMLPSPSGLAGMAGDSQVDLSWIGVDDVDHYNIYRNGETTVFASTSDLTFTDTDVTNGETYTYYVTAVFLNTGEESGPSNAVTVVPMPPISFPFYDDFETGGPYWSYEGTWGLVTGTYHSASYSLTESPSGNYGNDLDISATLRSLNLTGATSAQISFWTKYSTESGYDYLYLEASLDGIGWDYIAEFTGTQNQWVQKTYSLENYLNLPNVFIRFRFTSDEYLNATGVNIDDIEIDVSGVGIGENPVSIAPVVRIQPNPATDHATVSITLQQGGDVRLELADATGRSLGTICNTHMDAGTRSQSLDLSGLQEGTYFIIVEADGNRSFRKFIITR
jgi:hypothetical protein